MLLTGAPNCDSARVEHREQTSQLPPNCCASLQLEILDAAIDAFDEGTRSQMTDTQASTLASQA